MEVRIQAFIFNILQGDQHENSCSNDSSKVFNTCIFNVYIYMHIYVYSVYL